MMPEKILIVDDDIDSLKLIGLMLQRHNYEVIAANNGSQALSKAVSELPDLIILDVMMPDMNGYEVTKRLRDNPKTKPIPIIMFTAKTLIDDKVAGFEAGADDYLTKPTHPAELASRVKTILERSANRRSKDDGNSRIIGVLGTKGGVGTTTVTLNLGASLNSHGEDTLIIDLCLGHGSMGFFIGHDIPNGTANVVSKPPDEITPALITEEMLMHGSGLKTLLSSTRPREAHLSYTAESTIATVKAARSVAETVLLDLGNGYSSLFNRLKNEIDLLLLVVEPTSVSLKIAQQILAEVTNKQVDIVVVNREKADESQTPWQDIESALNKEIRAIITAAHDIAFEASESGTTIIAHSPNSVVAGQISKLAQTLIQNN